jgi:hypothetical protein
MFTVIPPHTIFQCMNFFQPIANLTQSITEIDIGHLINNFKALQTRLDRLECFVNAEFDFC